MPADQPGGGEGGNTTDVPENQLFLSRGSAEMMVISGRLEEQTHFYRQSTCRTQFTFT